MNEPTILLIEDSEDDIFVMKHALKKSGIQYPLQVVTDGEMALRYLGGEGDYVDRERFPIPFIIFLDLKLPYLNGFEVLSWIRKQRIFDTMVVVVLTGSAETKDHDKAYALGARSYLVKPPTPQCLNDLFNSLKSFWNATPPGSAVVSEPA